ncbi:hypothetical protein [Streptomyces sp. NPDC059909]|uniref:hypothetical protein n=1 Tax=Streptomyces sp. NPDC059909 TaxID=3346998 RepID=UPI0036659857
MRRDAQGKLTLSTPLEPGSPVTFETCSASNTLQRRRLTDVRGGYRLTNAIPQMAVHVTPDARMVRYPSDQQQPAVWRLAAH